MINTIIFDFGDVFVNLNKDIWVAEFKKLGLDGLKDDLVDLNSQFEMGQITEQQFLEGFKKHIPDADVADIRSAWNSLIGDFPLHRLEFLQMLCGKYRLFLLTNTDSIHIDYFEQHVGMTFSRDFYGCFEKVYYSYEIGKRKPDRQVFEYIIRKHDLNPARTLFIDDKKENTDAAAEAGLKVWNLQPGIEDVVDLFNKKYHTA